MPVSSEKAKRRTYITKNSKGLCTIFEQLLVLSTMMMVSVRNGAEMRGHKALTTISRFQVNKKLAFSVKYENLYRIEFFS